MTEKTRPTLTRSQSHVNVFNLENPRSSEATQATPRSNNSKKSNTPNKDLQELNSAKITDSTPESKKRKREADNTDSEAKKSVKTEQNTSPTQQPKRSILRTPTLRTPTPTNTPVALSGKKREREEEIQATNSPSKKVRFDEESLKSATQRRVGTPSSTTPKRTLKKSTLSKLPKFTDPQSLAQKTPGTPSFPGHRTSGRQPLISPVTSPTKLSVEISTQKNRLVVRPPNITDSQWVEKWAAEIDSSVTLEHLAITPKMIAQAIVEHLQNKTDFTNLYQTIFRHEQDTEVKILQRYIAYQFENSMQEIVLTPLMLALDKLLTNEDTAYPQQTIKLNSQPINTFSKDVFLNFLRYTANYYKDTITKNMPATFKAFLNELILGVRHLLITKNIPNDLIAKTVNVVFFSIFALYNLPAKLIAIFRGIVKNMETLNKLSQHCHEKEELLAKQVIEHEALLSKELPTKQNKKIKKHLDALRDKPEQKVNTKTRDFIKKHIEKIKAVLLTKARTYKALSNLLMVIMKPASKTEAKNYVVDAATLEKLKQNFGGTVLPYLNKQFYLAIDDNFSQSSSVLPTPNSSQATEAVSLRRDTKVTDSTDAELFVPMNKRKNQQVAHTSNVVAAEDIMPEYADTLDTLTQEFKAKEITRASGSDAKVMKLTDAELSLMIDALIDITTLIDEFLNPKNQESAHTSNMTAAEDIMPKYADTLDTLVQEFKTKTVAANLTNDGSRNFDEEYDELFANIKSMNSNSQ